MDICWAIEPEDLIGHDYMRLLDATRSGDASALLALIQAGVHCTPTRPLPTASLSPLAVEACIYGERDALEILLERDPEALNAVDPTHRAGLLHWASKRGDTGTIALLLSRGAQVDAVDAEGFVPLHYASESGRRAAAHLLLTSGAQVNIPGGDSQVTPLILAAGSGHAHCVELFLVSSADIEARDVMGRTALIAAATGGHAGVVRALLKAGADVCVVDMAQRRNALHWAANSGCYPAVEALLAVNRELVNAVDVEEETPLLLASRRGFEHAVSLLLNHGAAVDACNRYGVTGLAAASLFGHRGVVAQLVGAGGSVTSCDGKFRRTPLHQAVLGGDIDVVHYLMQHGASADQIQSARELALEVVDDPAVIHLLSGGV